MRTGERSSGHDRSRMLGGKFEPAWLGRHGDSFTVSSGVECV
jgi:hypothetical protein